MAQVQPPTCSTTAGARGESGVHWSIPLSVCKNARNGQDKHGHDCLVTDCTLHPDSIKQGQADVRFMKIMVEAAMENVAKAMTVQLSKDYKLPRMTFKGTPEYPDGPCVTVRSHATSSVWQ